MVRCGQVHKLYPLYIDGSLPAARVKAIEEHLNSCAACRRELVEWENLASALRSLEAPLPPADFCNRVLGRITAEEERYPLSAARSLWPNLFGKNGRFIQGLRLRSGVVRVAAATAAAALLAWGSWSLSTGAWWDTPTPTISQKEVATSQPVPSESEKVSSKGTGSGVDSGKDGITAPSANKSARTPESTSDGPVLPSAPPTGEDHPPVLAKRDTPGAASRPVAFLNKERQIISSLLRVQVKDLARAEALAEAAGQNAGARVQELARSQAPGRQQLGLKFTVDTARANALLVRLTSLGRVTDRKSETRDITTDFSNTLQLYYYWIGLRPSITVPSEAEAVDQEIARLEKQLASWEEEAKKQVMVLWLEESED